MATFKELYEKQRTITHKIPDKLYIKDDNGEYIFYQTEYKSKLNITTKGMITDDIYIECKDGNYRRHQISRPYPAYFSDEPIQYYSIAPYDNNQIHDKKHVSFKDGNPIRYKTIFATALSLSISTWKLCLTSKFMWIWFIGLITDGYWMVFTTPLVWLNWIFASLIYIPSFFILSSLVIASFFWAYTVELTASIVNKEWNAVKEQLKYTWVGDN